MFISVVVIHVVPIYCALVCYGIHTVLLSEDVIACLCDKYKIIKIPTDHVQIMWVCMYPYCSYSFCAMSHSYSQYYCTHYRCNITTLYNTVPTLSYRTGIVMYVVRL
jgi:hypothetical protein